jgi:D-3-phosphoglycerate dehydrogenase
MIHEEHRMVRPRVLITEPIHPIGVERLAREAEVINLPARPGESIDQHLPEVEAVVVRTAKLDATWMDRAPRLRIIAKHGVGVDNIDVDAANARGIVVTSTPGANAEAVAEHALTLMLVLARQIPASSRMLLDGKWGEARGTALSTDLQGKTLGLIGLGNIGGRLAEIARGGLGMRVLAYDPYARSERAAELGVELVPDLGPLLEAADVISIHTPLTPETRGIVDAAALRRMKPTTILINCARGGLVDENALLAALDAGELAGAGLDVFEEEPPLPDHPLLHHPKVVVTPHVAGGSKEARRLTAETLADDVLRVLHGQQPRYPYRP